jgi:plasmid maintenance system antidote protein VapI
MTPAELRATRERLGLTQARLAQSVEPPVARTDIVNIESGRRPIGAGMAARLREAIRRLEQGRDG